MVYEFPYKAGDIVPYYVDWETQTTEEGTAQLLRFVTQGRSFILEDVYPEVEQEVFNYQTWVVLKDDKEILYNVRYLDTLGISNSATDEENDDKIFNQLPKDSFLEFNGIQIY